ncbi:hypothetical protein B0H10DRAFT_2222258 [Mycena sp. CBHHK59/15]|nr:hypothetical protein B0H10DRAFT_2222258 [Mycena sp. CBHHK59/15]
MAMKVFGLVGSFRNLCGVARRLRGCGGHPWVGRDTGSGKPDGFAGRVGRVRVAGQTRPAETRTRPADPSGPAARTSERLYTPTRIPTIRAVNTCHSASIDSATTSPSLPSAPGSIPSAGGEISAMFGLLSLGWHFSIPATSVPVERFFSQGALS